MSLSPEARTLVIAQWMSSHFDPDSLIGKVMMTEMPYLHEMVAAEERKGEVADEPTSAYSVFLDESVGKVQRTTLERTAELLRQQQRQDSWYAMHYARDHGLSGRVEEVLATEPSWKTLIPWPKNREFNAELEQMAPTLGSYPYARSTSALTLSLTTSQ